MAITVLWSDQAKETYAANIAYLESEWTEKELKKFVLRTEYVMLNIEDNPKLYPFSTKSRKVRRSVINKQITLYYRYYPVKKVVILLSFWNTYQDDRKSNF